MDKNKLEKLQKLAARKLKLRKDPRFQEVMKVLKAYGLLYTPQSHPLKYPLKQITFEQIDFAGKLEQRICEVLPALVLRHPSVIADPQNMPQDLKAICEEIRRKGTATSSFRGVAPTAYMTWVQEFKRPNSKDRQIRVNFRFSHEDKKRMERLRKKLGIESNSELIRRALEGLETRLK